MFMVNLFLIPQLSLMIGLKKKKFPYDQLSFNVAILGEIYTCSCDAKKLKLIPI